MMWKEPRRFNTFKAAGTPRDSTAMQLMRAAACGAKIPAASKLILHKQTKATKTRGDARCQSSFSRDAARAEMPPPSIPSLASVDAVSDFGNGRETGAARDESFEQELTEAAEGRV
jgi:hypothetical protein